LFKPGTVTGYVTGLAGERLDVFPSITRDLIENRSLTI